MRWSLVQKGAKWISHTVSELQLAPAPHLRAPNLLGKYIIAWTAGLWHCLLTFKWYTYMYICGVKQTTIILVLQTATHVFNIFWRNKRNTFSSTPARNPEILSIVFTNLFVLWPVFEIAIESFTTMDVMWWLFYWRQLIHSRNIGQWKCLWLC